MEPISLGRKPKPMIRGTGTQQQAVGRLFFANCY